MVVLSRPAVVRLILLSPFCQGWHSDKCPFCQGRVMNTLCMWKGGCTLCRKINIGFLGHLLCKYLISSQILGAWSTQQMSSALPWTAALLWWDQPLPCWAWPLAVSPQTLHVSLADGPHFAQVCEDLRGWSWAGMEACSCEEAGWGFGPYSIDRAASEVIRMLLMATGVGERAGSGWRGKGVFSMWRWIHLEKKETRAKTVGNIGYVQPFPQLTTPICTQVWLNSQTSGLPESPWKREEFLVNWKFRASCMRVAQCQHWDGSRFLPLMQPHLVNGKALLQASSAHDTVLQVEGGCCGMTVSMATGKTRSPGLLWPALGFTGPDGGLRCTCT